MTSKERMMRALQGEKPDRLPVTVHQWQPYHLDTYLNGRDALEAFRYCDLDASIQHFEPLGQFWSTKLSTKACSPDWREAICLAKDDPDNVVINHSIETPGGRLTYSTGANRMTTWITDYLIKRPEDLDLIEKYMPVPRLDRRVVAAEYDRVGDAGILRGAVWGDQAGC